jgi:hypothetical protein
METNKFCLNCNEKLVGRTDKKFCSDYCRTHYHNALNKEIKDPIRNM